MTERDRMPSNAIHGSINSLGDGYLVPYCRNCHKVIHINGSPAEPVYQQEIVDSFASLHGSKTGSKPSLTENMLPKMDHKQREYLEYIAQAYFSNDDDIDDTTRTYSKYSSVSPYLQCPNDCKKCQIIWKLILKIEITDSFTKLTSVKLLACDAVLADIQYRAQLESQSLQSKDAQFQLLLILAKFLAPWVANRTRFLIRTLGLHGDRENQFFFFQSRQEDETIITKIEQGLSPFVERWANDHVESTAVDDEILELAEGISENDGSNSPKNNISSTPKNNNEKDTMKDHGMPGRRITSSQNDGKVTKPPISNFTDKPETIPESKRPQIEQSIQDPSAPIVVLGTSRGWNADRSWWSENEDEERDINTGNKNETYRKENTRDTSMSINNGSPAIKSIGSQQSASQSTKMVGITVGRASDSESDSNSGSDLEDQHDDRSGYRYDNNSEAMTAEDRSEFKNIHKNNTNPSEPKIPIVSQNSKQRSNQQERSLSDSESGSEPASHAFTETQINDSPFPEIQSGNTISSFPTDFPFKDFVPRRRSGVLPEKIHRALLKWLYFHLDITLPSMDQYQELQNMTGLKHKSIYRWIKQAQSKYVPRMKKLKGIWEARIAKGVDKSLVNNSPKVLYEKDLNESNSENDDIELIDGDGETVEVEDNDGNGDAIEVLNENRVAIEIDSSDEMHVELESEIEMHNGNENQEEVEIIDKIESGNETRSEKDQKMENEDPGTQNEAKNSELNLEKQSTEKNEVHLKRMNANAIAVVIEDIIEIDGGKHSNEKNDDVNIVNTNNNDVSMKDGIEIDNQNPEKHLPQTEGKAYSGIPSAARVLENQDTPKSSVDSNKVSLFIDSDSFEGEVSDEDNELANSSSVSKNILIPTQQIDSMGHQTNKSEKPEEQGNETSFKARHLASQTIVEID
ncbi:hypothetical protein DASC09_003920 [Saccharomycopsis crataegensis]|uniref:Homeobox domain-containing protein n=1 Tax=Saccharomycopsis crataegensis TaxID=43959 RepID=A0AAV5QEI3_9ASCO|nr:hypothetical protein DASC09_003920 [Saccharomycopsis crataegensis]